MATIKMGIFDKFDWLMVGILMTCVGTFLPILVPFASIGAKLEMPSGNFPDAPRICICCSCYTIHHAMRFLIVDSLYTILHKIKVQITPLPV